MAKTPKSNSNKNKTVRPSLNGTFDSSSSLYSGLGSLGNVVPVQQYQPVDVGAFDDYASKQKIGSFSFDGMRSDPTAANANLVKTSPLNGASGGDFIGAGVRGNVGVDYPQNSIVAKYAQDANGTNLPAVSAYSGSGEGLDSSYSPTSITTKYKDDSPKPPAPQETVSYLGSIGNSLGFSGWGDGRKNGTIYSTVDADGNKQWMQSGMFTDSKVDPSSLNSGQFNSYADFKSVNSGSNLTEDQWNTNKHNQAFDDNASDRLMLGAGMGLGQLGLGVMNYFGQKDMNEKNMQLIDQQIADNTDRMATRKARQADIAKAFGSGSNAAKI